MLKIFLAHAKEDKKIVTDLYYRLKERGYEPWLDKEDLLPGQFWRAEIPKAIKNSQVFIACLSSRSVEKQGYVQDEFKMALKTCAGKPAGSIYLIPIRLDECIIPELRQEEYGMALRDIQWLDFFEADGFDKLIRALEYAKKVTPTKNSSNVPIDDSFIPIPPSIPSSLDTEASNSENSEQGSPPVEDDRDVDNPTGFDLEAILRGVDRRIIIGLASLLLVVGFVSGLLFILKETTSDNSVDNKSDGEEFLDNDFAVSDLDPAVRENFSSGERLLTIRSICRDATSDCVDSLTAVSESFENAANGDKDYGSVIEGFDAAIKNYPNKPELRIYLNNALVKQAVANGFSGRKITLAAAVPASTPESRETGGRETEGRAEEMLRGIADAQSCYVGVQDDDEFKSPFNCPSNSDELLLEVLVVDDKNDPDKAKENARAIVGSKVISGVIGHYASGVTDAALTVYSSNEVDGSSEPIPVISPASTKYDLKRSDNFYRTTASTEKQGTKIADYLQGQGVEAVLEIYDSEDEYSKALWGSFEKAFPDSWEKGKTVIRPSNSTSIVDDLEADFKEKLEEWIDDGEKFAVFIAPPSTFNNGTLTEEQKWELIVRISEAVREKDPSGQNSFLIGGNDLYAPEALDVSNSLYGMVFTVSWFSGYYEAASQESYAAKAKAKWRGRVSWATANSYDATHVFMQAFADINPEDSEIRRKLIDRIQEVRLTSEYSSGEDLVFEDREPDREPLILEVLEEESSDNPKKYDLSVVDDFL